MRGFLERKCAWVRLLGSDSWRYAKSVGEDRPAERVGEDVVEIEIKLADDADAVTGCVRHRDPGLEGELPFVGYIDGAGLEISCLGHPGDGAVVNRGLESELSDGDQVLEEVVVDRSDVRVEVRQAVLEGEPPVERGHIWVAVCVVLPRRGRAEFAGYGERAQIFEGGRQRSEAQTKIHQWRVSVLPTGAGQDSRAGSGPGYVEADLEHELSVWDAQRLPLQLGGERVPAVAARVLPCRSGADHHAEARGDRLRPAEARVPLVGAVGVEGNITDGRQRELVLNAWIVDSERGGENAVAADGMRVGRREPQRCGRARKGAHGRAEFRGWHRGFSSLKECERAPEGARGGLPSDCEGRGPGRIWLGGIGRKNVPDGRRADRVRLAIDSAGQDRQVWRDKGHGLGGEAAQRTLIAAMAGRRVPGWNFVVVDLDAELGGVAEKRLEFGGDRRVIGAGESGRGDRRRRRGGEKLNDERERDKEGRERRPERRRAALSAPVPKRKFSAAEAHQNIPPMPYSVAERTRERNSAPFLSRARPPSAKGALITVCSKHICVLSETNRYLNVLQCEFLSLL
jgi:hypothetical protein